MYDSRCKAPANRLRLISHYRSGSEFLTCTHTHASARAERQCACTLRSQHMGHNAPTYGHTNGLSFLPHAHTLQRFSLLRWHPATLCHCLPINSCNHVHGRRAAVSSALRKQALPTCRFHGLQMTNRLADPISWAQAAQNTKMGLII